MLFLCYPKCITCQKTQKWLVGLRNIKEANPTAEELRAWHAASGLLYKELGLKDKLPTLTEEQIALLSMDGMLVKRPMLIGDGFVLVGFKEDAWEKALL